MAVLSIEYTFFVFFAAIGVIQIAAAKSDLKGLFFIPSRRASAILGAAVMLTAFVWFFLLVNRNVRGLEGMEQTVLFVPAAVAAVLVTAVGSSLSHRILGTTRVARGVIGDEALTPTGDTSDGLEALRRKTYLDAIRGDDNVTVR